MGCSGLREERCSLGLSITMPMFFWFGIDLGAFMLPGYVVKSPAAFAGTCLGLVALAIAYEAMKPLQIKLHRLTKVILHPTSDSRPENSSLLSRVIPYLPKSSKSSRCFILCQWLLEVLHYSAHTTLGYIFMLAVMTYNIYISISLVIGSAIGYWFFSPALLELSMNDLRQKYNAVPCETECADSLETTERHSSASTVADQLVSEVNAEIHVVSDT